LFNHRQLVVMEHFVDALKEEFAHLENVVSDHNYSDALSIYLALWLDRIAMFNNTFCRWESGLERPKTPFGGQSIPMMWDFPEINPFGTLAGTGATQLEYLTKAVRRQAMPGMSGSINVLLASATTLPLEDNSIDYCVTDPPYGNSIAYADLSDFFYVWLKRVLGDKFETVFATPQTPKEQEATSHKHRHEGSQKRSNLFYRKLLTESFRECKRVGRGAKLVSVMFAHQSTEAWSALLSALFDAGLCPNASWPIATEMPTTQLAMGTASLETSVTVACRPRVVGSAASFQDVRREVDKVLKESVKRFWSYGFRGADLIVACYGPAVGVFGKYERVEKADGTPVEIPELLDLARQAARDAIAGEFRGDNFSTLITCGLIFTVHWSKRGTTLGWWCRSAAMQRTRWKWLGGTGSSWWSGRSAG
jgi:adenine-specific DNA methylase